MVETFNFVGLLISLVPFIIMILAFKWLFNIKKNSDEQVKMNREILSLLQEQESEINVNRGDNHEQRNQ
ncbi:hypothetical protein [Salisediminibacterium halotolerans]|uniref:hypothetical protein n=1 Tax=Salisediminibacterium halotolerans TaxID=517425 RepID=UPI000EAB71BA|nr:hypothetical protein [Salisediminibacterium halotolerans]RLJ72271.1 hypothetical protein BCL39_2170 [Actinophytocola xinjiangensis]RPE85485.1 hypothetical protein EDD67_2305 [Salisediminibacterium halotolerans]TWG33440.1 hypothetical protein BCL52_2165 [Salisediminibacterium halotolerans]GEL07052.1 hypothetical protein SHA02_04680 [Salisediminibacterium halotolerans]